MEALIEKFHTGEEPYTGHFTSCLESLLPEGHVHISSRGICNPGQLPEHLTISDSCMPKGPPPPASYLFLVASIGELKEQLEDVSCDRQLWYPSIWTVVIFCGLVRPHLRVHLARHVFQKLWEYSIYHSALLIDGSIVYRADPFAPANRCGEELSEVYLTNCSYYNYEEPFIFPGCDLKVSARDSVPFSFWAEGSYRGSDVMITRLIASYSGLKINWATRTSQQSSRSNNEVHAYYENISRNEIDLAIGGSVIIYNYFFNVTYAHSHTIQHLQFYVADCEDFRGWRRLIGMFSLKIWTVILMSMLVTVIALTLFGRRSLVEYIFMIFGSLFEEPIRKPSGKMKFILISILLPFFSIRSTYTTYLHSFTMNPPKICQVSSIEDIIEKNVSVMVSGVNDFMTSKIQTILVQKALKNKVKSPSLSESVRLLDGKKNFVLLERDLAMKYMINSKGYRIHNIPYTVRTLRNSLVLSKGSIFRNRVDTVIVRCVESGLCGLWIKQALGRPPNKNPSLSNRPIKLSDFDSAFTVLGIGISIAVISFILEFIIHKSLIKRIKAKEKTSKKNFKRKILPFTY